MYYPKASPQSEMQYKYKNTDSGPFQNAIIGTRLIHHLTTRFAGNTGMVSLTRGNPHRPNQAATVGSAENKAGPVWVPRGIDGLGYPIVCLPGFPVTSDHQWRYSYIAVVLPAFHLHSRQIREAYPQSTIDREVEVLKSISRLFSLLVVLI